MNEHPIRVWHGLIEEANPAGLDDLLAEEAVFHSPIVHTPQVGKAITKLYLSAAFAVLFGPQFRYVREVIGDTDAALEFETEIDGIHINGVDLIRWDEYGRITDFKVLLRPLKAVNLVHHLMGEMLQGTASR
jgi:hypothetical protein